MPLQKLHTHGTKNFQHLPMLFMDAETTGLALSRGGEICEIGLVKVDPVTLLVMDELDLKLAVANPLNMSEDELSFKRYNGFSFAEWVDAKDPSVALNEMLAFSLGCVPWAYNVSFEFTWLEAYFDRYNREWTGDYHWHDLMSIASHVLRPDFQAGKIAKLSLSSVGSYLGLAEEATPHRGLAGARYEHVVYQRLLEYRS